MGAISLFRSIMDATSFRNELAIDWASASLSAAASDIRDRSCIKVNKCG